MSLLRHTTRRSFNVAMINTPAVARLPLFARTFSSQTSLFKDKNVIKHAPGWDHEKASASEASVKADREPHPKNVEHLQQETVKHLHQDNGDVLNDMKNKAQSVGENVSQQTKEYANKAKNIGENLADQGKDMSENLSQVAQDAIKNSKEAVAHKVGETNAENLAEQGKEYAEKAKQGAQQAAKQGQKYAEMAKEGAQQSGESVLGGVKSGAEKVTQFVKESVDSAKKAVGMNK
ncbi:hypothetical protein EDD11_010423 [Mortierella claussenii]|nr:hypothetical protein EDD11_010423 [Mortierella claussenii]